MVILENCDIFKSTCEAICHQVNCMGVMGSGIAFKIKNKYPYVYYRYNEIRYIALMRNELHSLLGKIQCVKTKDFIVINMFTQFNYGRNRCHTDYDAFQEALYRILDYCNKNSIKTIAFPYKIGCVRGGGDWNKILSIINTVFENDATVLCKICKFTEDKNYDE